MDLRERPQDDDVSVFAHITNRIRRIIQKLIVSFIKNGNDVLRNVCYKTVDLALRNESAGWIVRIGDQDEACCGCYCLDHGVQIMPMIPAGDVDGSGTEQGRGQLIGNERVLGDNNAIAAVEESVAQKFDNLV